MGKLKEINFVVVLPAVILTLFVIILNAASPDAFSVVLEGAVMWFCKNLGWIFGTVTVIICIFLIALMIHPISKTRVGGKDAKPEYSTYRWWAMIICSSIAIGIVFYGVAEPMYHFGSPQPSSGIEPFSDAAIINAMSQTHIHWAFGQYCYYALFAMIIAVAVYNFKQPMTISSAFYFLNSKPLKPGWSKVVDAVAIFGTVAGVTYSLGLGIMQLGAGLDSVFGIDPTYIVWLCTAIGVVVFFTISSIIGINKGMNRISDWNVKIFIALGIYVLIIGPTAFIFNMAQEGIADYVVNFLPKTLFTGGPSEDAWAITWTYMSLAAAGGVAPVVGLFQARISKGRTIRELIFAFWVVPVILMIVWFSVFGLTGIDMQRSGEYDLWTALNESGMEASIFAFFQALPLGKIITPIFLICVVLSFATFADANIGSIALMTLKDQTALASDKEAPAYLKFVWGILIGLSSLAFITLGGVFTIRRLPTIAAFPVYALIIVLLVAVFRFFFSDRNQALKDSLKNLKEDEAETVQPEMGGAQEE